jgi:hypothetical protein
VLAVSLQRKKMKKDQGRPAVPEGVAQNDGRNEEIDWSGGNRILGEEYLSQPL